MTDFTTAVGGWTLTLREVVEMALGKCFWNLYALCYDAIARLIPYQQMMTDIVTALQLKPGMRILDAGCGTGNLEVRLAKAGVPVAADAVDFSEAMLNRARRKNTGRGFCFRLCDLRERLPYDDGTFDAVVCNNVLYALPNADRVVAELRRVLKSGGVLIINDPNPDSKFMAIFWEHLLSGGWAMAAWRLLVLFAGLTVVPRLALVAVANVMIDIKGRQGRYVFRSDEQWVQVLGENRATSTYAGQNRLHVAWR